MEGPEPKSESSDNNRTEEENNRTDNEVDEGVDLQGTVNIIIRKIKVKGQIVLSS